MNATLNLASRPFNNRALPWIATIFILFVSLVGLVIVVQLTTTARREVSYAEADVNKLKQEEQSLITSAKELEALLTPQQQQALQAAHRLVDRKTFSWSRLFADLEASLPDSVRVSRIAVREVSMQGDQVVAQLDLGVFSKSSTTIIDMIKAMDQNGIFHANLVSQNLQKGRGEAGSEYELSVVYRPRAGFVGESLAEVHAKPASEDEAK